MKKQCYKYLLLILSTILCIWFVGCSTKKNTAKSRWWHSFNAKYNTYYNGSQAYIAGSLEKENNNKDNFIDIIPLFTVANKNTKEIGKNSFDIAIKKAEKAIALHSIKRKPEWNKTRRKTPKDIEWLSRKEYNPFLWKAWMLLGKSQFYKGAFEEAASTFSYMSRIYKTQSVIYSKARLWLAISYIEAGWIYEAENVIRNLSRNHIEPNVIKDWNYALTDLYLHTGELEKAVPYLEKVIKKEKRKKQKAREFFLLGQLLTQLGRNGEAFKAFKNVIHLSPNYELAFNARIASTEVMAKGNSKQMISKLKRMASSDNNKNYIDQIFYAIGNIYIAERDTVAAISAYEQGNKKSTNMSIEKGTLLLKLGNLYWEKEKFTDARRCYNQAIGLLDKDQKYYEELSNRATILDQLTPFTDAVQLQDSLQYLAKCSEDARNKAIDKVIQALRKKEKEERNKLEEQEVETRQNSNDISDIDDPFADKRPQIPTKQNEGVWYFYNPIAVQQGKNTFRRLWGKRENIDNWQRINKTVVNKHDDNSLDTKTDSLYSEDSINSEHSETNKNLPINDPHKREYYMQQIPFTKEKIEESNKIIEEGLHKAGVIFKDLMGNVKLSEKYLKRLEEKYPNYEKMDDVYYHLYLLYMNKQQPQVANLYISKLKTAYPKSQWTAILTNPYFKENAKFGRQIEDSLYTATYNAFKKNRFDEVETNNSISKSRFPLGENRDKFIFITGLSKLNQGNIKESIKYFNDVVDNYPQSRISEMAGMIINGINEGKRVNNAQFDLGNVWNYRATILNDSTKLKTFSNETNVDYKFLIVYNPDSINENKLLYELARFNFTSFYVRNFNINIVNLQGLHQMQVAGFKNIEEAQVYSKQLLKSSDIVNLIKKQARTFVISDNNLKLLGTVLSYNDYEQFYKKHFALLPLVSGNTLNELTKLDDNDKENSTNQVPKADNNDQQSNNFIMVGDLDTVSKDKKKDNTNKKQHKKKEPKDEPIIYFEDEYKDFNGF